MEHVPIRPIDENNTDSLQICPELVQYRAILQYPGAHRVVLFGRYGARTATLFSSIILLSSRDDTIPAKLIDTKLA